MAQIKITRLELGHEGVGSAEACKTDVRGSSTDLRFRFKVEGEDWKEVRTENPLPPPPPAPEAALPEDKDPVKILMNLGWHPTVPAPDGGPRGFAIRAPIEGFELSYVGWFFCYCESPDGFRCRVRRFRCVTSFDGIHHPTAAVQVSQEADCSALADLVVGPELLNPTVSEGGPVHHRDATLRFQLEVDCPCAANGKGGASGETRCLNNVAITYRYEAVD